MEQRSHSSQLMRKGPSPLLTPMERFLSAPCERKMQPHNSTKAAPRVAEAYNVVPHIGAVGILPRGVLLDESAGMYDGLLVEGDSVSGGYDILREAAAAAAKSGSCNSSASATLAPPATSVVKGQWTAEEDSMLVNLVKQHGVRKWSQIAKRLAGRIGKQCRERWHNHLRPDIKKDTWSEEEEKLLVEAHEKVGNRWAEIAKRIPGRSENSIKNHWNATKRRQNSKRKSKSRKSGQAGPHPSVLQEYIQSKTLAENYSLVLSNPPPPPPPAPSAHASSFSNFSTAAYNNLDEDCLQYGDDDIQDVSLDFLGFGGGDDGAGHFLGLEGGCVAPSQAHAGPAEAPAPDHSEMYLSYLLEGGPSPSFDAVGSGHWEDFNGGDRRRESFGFKKDMDLIEMISSSQSSCSQRSSGTSLDCLNF